MTTSIEPFFGMLHMYDTVQALMRVRAADASYPPPLDVDEGDLRGFIEWLMKEETLGRWVAVVSGEVVGHISLTAPQSYLTGYLESVGHQTDAGKGYCEVSKFFVAPEYQSYGIGSILFEHALAFARSNAMQPALAVIDDSFAARKFYAKKGMREVGSFTGIHGENFVFTEEMREPVVVVTMVPATVTVDAFSGASV